MKKKFYVEQQENRSSQAMQATGAHNQITTQPLFQRLPTGHVKKMFYYTWRLTVVCSIVCCR